MTTASPTDSRVDLAIILLSVIIIAGTVWVWLTAAPISREIIFISTTLTLIISLVLVINLSVLIILRLQKRVSHLETMVSSSSSGGDQPSQNNQVLVVTLSNTERRIINSLKENGGVLTQDELRRNTGLSKSTLSTSLSALERKSLIEREIYGRTKIVRLKIDLKC